jgi:hypothetical protein
MHWHFRAEEARRLADKIDDPAAKAAKYEMADKYERLAARAREWVDRAGTPRFRVRLARRSKLLLKKF